MKYLIILTLFIISCMDNTKQSQKSLTDSSPTNNMQIQGPKTYEETQEKLILSETDKTNHNKIEVSKINLSNFPQDNLERFAILEEAIKNNQLDIVRYGIDQGFPVNSTNYGSSLLHISANQGNIEIFDYFISQGADINLLIGGEEFGYFNAIMYGALGDQVDLVKHSLAMYSNQITNIFNTSINESMYHIALRYYSPNILTYLIDSLQYPIDDTAIVSAVVYMNTNTLEYLYQKGFTNINTKDEQGKTPLEWITSDDTQIIREIYPKQVEQTITWLKQKTLP